jgi:predicted alpha/beta-hydrolase family hydrolase
MHRFHIEVDAQRTVSALLLSPAKPAACFGFAHGAGAGMTHPFMETIAMRLFERDIATLRYQFPSYTRRRVTLADLDISGSACEERERSFGK